MKKILAALPLILMVVLCACTTPRQNPVPSPSSSPSGSPTVSAAPGAEAAATPDSRLASSKTYQYFSARTNGDYVVQLRTHSGYRYAIDDDCGRERQKRIQRH